MTRKRKVPAPKPPPPKPSTSAKGKKVATPAPAAKKTAKKSITRGRPRKATPPSPVSSPTTSPNSSREPSPITRHSPQPTSSKKKETAHKKRNPSPPASKGRGRQGKVETSPPKKRRKKAVDDDLVPTFFQPTNRRSCFADTSVNNKWNFGPMASLNRRRRDEVYENYFQFAGQNTSRVKKSYKKGTIRYELEVIHPFVSCRLCEGYLIDATTIIDCMHTFCKSCLLLYFEEDQNTCPTCGILIHGSHPAQYVTYDRAINDLVMKLVPGLEQGEKDSRKAFLNQLRTGTGIDLEAEEKAKKAAKEAEKIRGTNRCYRGDPQVSHHRDDNQVMVKLVPGTKSLPLVNRPFVRTSEMTTINSLKKFITLALWDDINRYNDLDIFCGNQLMGKDFSIRFVWMMKKRDQPRSIPLELEYRMAQPL